MDEPIYVCKQCRYPKPLSAFAACAKLKRGYRHICKECHNGQQRKYRRENEGYRNSNNDRQSYFSVQRRRQRYGIEPEDFDRLLEIQGGGCAICERMDGPFVVDHCHRTGLVRGVLCVGCNTKLAVVEDAEFTDLAHWYLARVPDDPTDSYLQVAHECQAFIANRERSLF